MTYIVINTVFGGFGLSKKALIEYKKRAEIIEDELLLNVPYTPMHEDCDALSYKQIEEAAPVKENPFQALAALKKSSTKNLVFEIVKPSLNRVIFSPNRLVFANSFLISPTSYSRLNSFSLIIVI